MKIIKYLVVSGLISVTLSNVALAEEKSGVFAGGHVGIVALGWSIYDNGTKNKDLSQHVATFNAGLQAGYQKFFSPMLGVRGYLSYDLSVNAKFSKVNNRFGFHNFALNADALVNFINSDSWTLGAFIGFGLAYGITVDSGNKLNNDKYNGFNIPINLGVATTFGSHKVEIGGKIQTLAAKFTRGNTKLATNPHTIYVGYSYIF